MSSIYILNVHSVEGAPLHCWRARLLHSKTPKLYVAINLNGVEMDRTAMKRDRAPKWDHLSRISSENIPSSAITLRLFQHSLLAYKDICLGSVDIMMTTLLECCAGKPNGTTKFVKLDLTAVDGTSTGNSAGTLCVCLMKDSKAAATALERASRKLRHTPSVIVEASEIVSKSAPMTDDFEAALGAMTAKLELIVRIGDTVTQIHPYANMAWKVLHSVYRAGKKQQVIDVKLCCLVQTMLDVYSFVEDLELLADKIKSLEDKALAIVKQTVECALFIQEYTMNGFCRHVLQNLTSWDDVERTIEDLSSALIRLKGFLDDGIAVQALFLSTKVLQRLDGLVRADALKKLNAMDMNASSRPLCLPGTRQKILDYIAEWLTVPSESGNILWLSGVAGSGKSTISTTLSESFRQVERLGAFLFFDRNDRVRSHPGGVIRTIANQLALSNSRITSAISAAILRDPAIVNAPIQAQFTKLLLEPLVSVEHLMHGPILIILDALDECGDPASRDALLSVISSDFPKLPRIFRILITSRRVADISCYFRSSFAEINLDRWASADDVQLFIRHELDRIRRHQNLGSTWPEEKDVQTLVTLAGGLFIWAATAVKFIASYRPENRLKMLIAQSSTTLYKLYSIALRNSGYWEDEEFARDARSVLACLVLGRVPMTEQTIDMLLGSGRRSADILQHLGCVVQWSPGAHARTLHASFADYLTDIDHSGGQPWAVDTGTGHRSLALGCFRILDSELRFNICGLMDSHLLNANVPDLTNRVNTAISPQLSYSSCFWFHHVQESPFNRTLLDDVTNFLQTKFLFWLEALSLLDNIPIAPAALRVAVNYIKGYDGRVEELADDMIKFVAAFAPVMAQSAPHIYLSAVPFTPRESKLVKEWKGMLPNTVSFDSVMMGSRWPGIQTILYGHSDHVTSVHFSPDGGRIVSGSDDGTVRVWDAQTAGLVAGPWEGHTGHVRSVHFSPDGGRIASGSDDGTVRVWDAQSGSLVTGPLEGHTDCVRSVCFSSDGMRLASGSDDRTLRIWNAETGALVAGPCEGLTGQIQSVHFSPDSTQIASGSGDGTVLIWVAHSGALAGGPFIMHTGPVNSVHFSPDGKRMASGSDDGTVCVWEVPSGVLVAGPFKGHTQWVTSVHFSPDGKQIASGSNDGTVRVWDAYTGALVAGPFDQHTDRIRSVHFSPDGSRIASGSNDNTVRIWNGTQTDSHGVLPFEPTQGHLGWVVSVDFSPDGMRIASGSKDGSVRVWATETSAFIAGPFEGHTQGVTSVHFSPDSKRIASGSNDRTVRVWDAHSGALVAGPFEGHTGHVNSVHFSPDGMQIASGSDDGTVCVWNAFSGRLAVGPFQGHTGGVCLVHFSPDGTRIASGSRDNTVRVWDALSGALVAGPCEGHTDWIASMYFSSDSRRIVSGSGDNTLRVWDAQTGALVAGPFQGHTGCVRCVHFSFDGMQIVSGSDDLTVRVWSAETGLPVAGPIRGHTLQVHWVHFSRDGTHITSGSLDASMRVFKLDFASESDNPLGHFPQFDTRNGWILGSSGQHMLWVPPWMREGLYLPHNTLITRAQGVTKLDLSRFVHGTGWQKCIDATFYGNEMNEGSINSRAGASIN